VNNIQNSTLFGMTCDGMDIIANSIGVPSALKVGDWLCLSGMGAYTYGCRSNFNGMKSTERVIRWPKVEIPVEAPERVFGLAF
jgi:diaminopimelate decarboxylase